MKNCWLLRPMPHGNNRMKVFLEKEIIAIGYPVGKTFQGLSYDEIRATLGKWAEGLGNVNIFVNIMKIGDIVIVPDDNKRDVYIGSIDGEYQHDIDLESEGYPHLRNVSWLFDKKPLFRNSLPDGIKNSMRYPGTLADLTKHIDTIENLITSEGTELMPSTTTTISSVETEAIEVLKDLLQSEKEEIRLKAAEVILSQISSGRLKFM